MDTMGCVQAPPIRKGKKKQAKDEVDRLKQAEKKKRRLEKALATSAAIRSELEKKKQKKKEEQERLDEEGAAIAEAVAMHVLLGEDSDDSCKIMLQKDEGFNPWNRASSIGLLMGGRKVGSTSQGYTMYSLEGLGRVSDAYGMGCKWNDWEIGSWTLSPDIFGKERHAPYFEDRIRGTEISAGLIAAQAVSSLQIAEDAHADSILINRMLRRGRWKLITDLCVLRCCRRKHNCHLIQYSGRMKCWNMHRRRFTHCFALRWCDPQVMGNGTLESTYTHLNDSLHLLCMDYSAPQY